MGDTKDNKNTAVAEEPTPAKAPAAPRQKKAAVQEHSLAELGDAAASGETGNIDLLLDVTVPVVVELGSTEMPIRDVLRVGNGSIIMLDKMAGEPVDLLVRGKLIAEGEVVVVDDSFGVRVTRVVSPDERAKGLREG